MQWWEVREPVFHMLVDVKGNSLIDSGKKGLDRAPENTIFNICSNAGLIGWLANHFFSLKREYMPDNKPTVASTGP